MTAANEQLAEAVRAAAGDGEVIAPTALEAVIGGLENQLAALQNTDDLHAAFDALNKEFGFIRLSFMDNRAIPKAQIQPADQLRYASLLRWLIRELVAWRKAADPRHAKLAAAFVVAQMCDSNNGLWDLLPDDVGENSELLDHLKNLIASFAVTFDSRPGAQVPIWETEAVEAFKRADVDGDWVAVIRGWEQFRHQLFFANTLQIQAVRLLNRYSFTRLAESVAQLRQTPVAMQLAGVLTPEQRLRLAIGSDNPRIQIAAMYRTLTDDRRPQTLTEMARRLLTELLLTVVNDPPRWAQWMKVFAGYPALQQPLGRTLAQVPDAALEGYIHSIWLYPKQPKPDAGRQSITECLRSFRAEASPQRRVVLWTLARERWLAWDFNKTDANQHLLAINWSDLDYAVVGYATECMDEAARNQAMELIRAELASIEHHWHGSFTDVLTSWNRLLSQFQPYAHAAFVAQNGDDWLPETKTYMPFEPSQNKYLIMMYRAM